MKLLNILRAIILPCSLFACFSAQANVTHVIDNGKLIGAENIIVNSIAYDVEFLDDSFDSVFQGVIPSFHSSRTDAELFANALLNQVFTSASLIGNLDTLPELTNGCEPSQFNRCDSQIPFTLFSTNSIRTIGAVNSTSNGSDGVVGPIVFSRTASLENDDINTYARFSLASPVPEPETYAMLFTGLMLMISFAKRRQFNA